jgi:hypothetical protein
MLHSNKKITLLAYVSTLLAFLFAFSTSYIRINTTLIGYEIGKLKKEETSLLKKRSLLIMKHAKITTKQHLLSIVSKKK